MSVKSRIVENATRVFLEKGFQGASIQDLVTAAGVPKGSFYNHFSGKEELAVEITRRWVADAGVDGLYLRTGSPLRRLREHLESVAGRRSVQYGPHGCLLGNFSTGVPAECERLRAQVAAGLDQWTAAVAAALAEARQVGELHVDTEVSVLARYVLDGFEGAIARGKVSGDPAVLRQWFDVTFSALLV
ncbi:TetR/AcrR family transcriptional regulator [Pseudonocardia sp.]|uniref:TetR/AcrR family transcriptional regulator n=1 Tax=Pseudonocardia sp. TaxID=60912 RepID=UPI003D10BF29